MSIETRAVPAAQTSPPSARPAAPRRGATGSVVRRVVGRAAVALGMLAAVGAGAVYALSERGMRRRVPVPRHPSPVLPAAPRESSAGAALVARGAHVAATRGCTECHGAALGGVVMVDDPMVGRLAGPNLTVGGRGPALDDRAWELAVRHGVRPDGRPLVVMPAGDYAGMTDADVAAVVAYARSLPAVHTRAPALRVGPLLRVLSLTGQGAVVVPAAHLAHRAAHAAEVTEAPTAAYGAYVASTCTGCHRADLAGGPVPGAPPGTPRARNLTPHPTAGIGRWTADDFDRLLTTGVRPDGRVVDTAAMPVRMTRTLSAVERRALWAYLRTVPARGGA